MILYNWKAVCDLQLPFLQQQLVTVIRRRRGGFIFPKTRCSSILDDLLSTFKVHEEYVTMYERLNTSQQRPRLHVGRLKDAQ